MITRPTDDGRTHAGTWPALHPIRVLISIQGAVRKIYEQCHIQGIITEDLVMPDDFNDLELVYRGLCRKDEKSKRRRIGLFCTMNNVSASLPVNRFPVDCMANARSSIVVLYRKFVSINHQMKALTTFLG